jgi:hypothetical protein
MNTMNKESDMAIEFFKEEQFKDELNTVTYKVGNGTAEFILLNRAAHIANRILSERGVRVYSGWHSHERGHSKTDMWSTTYWPHDKATHSALLISVQPIERDTPLSLLREYASKDLMLTSINDWLNLKERARKVLGKPEPKR